MLDTHQTLLLHMYTYRKEKPLLAEHIKLFNAMIGTDSEQIEPKLVQAKYPVMVLTILREMDPAKDQELIEEILSQIAELASPQFIGLRITDILADICA